MQSTNTYRLVYAIGSNNKCTWLSMLFMPRLLQAAAGWQLMVLKFIHQDAKLFQ
jgi:hypothetical protein